MMAPMNKVNVKNNFQFKGFTPNPNVKKQSRVFYNLIESRSPSDSRKTASLTKKGNFYEARLKISSAGDCSFEIFSKKNKLSDSMESLRRQFFDKIVTWNQNRDQKSLCFKK